MNEADFQALAQLLDGFGLAFSLTDAGGTPLLSNHRQRLHDSRVGTLQLADGRRVVLAAPAAPATGTERRRSDLRFQLLAEHSTDLLVAVDDDLRICYASPAAREMLGHAPDALVGRTLNELLAPDDRAAFMSRHFSKSPWRSNLPDMYRAQRADGGTRWVEARVAALRGEALENMPNEAIEVLLQDALRRDPSQLIDEDGDECVVREVDLCGVPYSDSASILRRFSKSLPGFHKELAVLANAEAMNSESMPMNI